MRNTTIHLPFKHLLGVRVLLVLVVFLSVNLQAQNLFSPKFYGAERVYGSRFLGKDVLDNSYWVTRNVVKKSRGSHVVSFSESALGNVYHVDLSSPVELGVFYKDFNTWVVLDQNLVFVQEYDFSKLLATYEVVFAAKSIRNTFWIVDQLGKSVNRYDPLRAQVTKVYSFISEEVKAYSSDSNHLYWVTTTNELQGVDVYGNKVLSVKIPFYDALQVIDHKTILYSYQNKLFYYDIEKSQSSEIRLRDKSISGFFFGSQKLSIFGNRILNNYHLNLS